jgi:hypothetical protein
MTPLRIVLTVIAIGAAVVAVFALFVDSADTKLPLLVASLCVFGISLGVLGFSLAGTSVRIGEDGRMGRALLTAFIAGVFVLVAAGSLAMAIVLGILAGGVA